ncbi:hypothetical protein [Baekduia soli]|uniref:hypothetical protein n=1 Tax=Baekduia soli TaxID=496014 RepID=UPI001652B060|nr:hypothetical protein [Baekduia soli]
MPPPAGGTVSTPLMMIDSQALPARMVSFLSARSLSVPGPHDLIVSMKLPLVSIVSSPAPELMMVSVPAPPLMSAGVAVWLSNVSLFSPSGKTSRAMFAAEHVTVLMSAPWSQPEPVSVRG